MDGTTGRISCSGFMAVRIGTELAERRAGQQPRTTCVGTPPAASPTTAAGRCRLWTLRRCWAGQTRSPGACRAGAVPRSGRAAHLRCLGVRLVTGSAAVGWRWHRQTGDRAGAAGHWWQLTGESELARRWRGGPVVTINGRSLEADLWRWIRASFNPQRLDAP